MGGYTVSGASTEGVPCPCNMLKNFRVICGRHKPGQYAKAVKSVVSVVLVILTGEIEISLVSLGLPENSQVILEKTLGP